MDAGSRIGKYRLLRRLGDGAMGVVWAAVNEDTHKEVALKLIASPDAELRRRLLREAKACGRLEHRNVVSVYDAGSTADGEPFLVMQLLTGDTLGARIERSGPLAPKDAARIAAAVAAGLAAAHAMGIIHRDLKPDNIFLHREPGTVGEVVKIVDFGVSRLSIGVDAGGTATGSIIGSPAYMSPEQARGARDLGTRSDLWSLGVVLFEMLTGTRPFVGASVVDVLAHVLTAPVPKVAATAPHVPESLCTIVDECLNRDPARRPASAAELSERLHAEAESSASRPIKPSLPSMADESDDDDPTQVASRQKLRAAIAPPAPDPATRGAPAPAPAPPAAPIGGALPPVGEIDDDQRQTAPMSTAVLPAAPAAPPSPASAPVVAATVVLPGPPAATFEAPVLGPATATSSTAPFTRGKAPTPPSLLSGRASPRLVVAGSLTAIAVSVLTIVGVLVSHRQPSPSADVPVASVTIDSAAAQQDPSPLPQHAEAPPEPARSAEAAALGTAPTSPDPRGTDATPGEAPAAADSAQASGPGGRRASWRGTLVIRSSAAAKVTLDGEVIGVTPLAPIAVPAGKHRITFKHTIFGERTVVTQVKGGETQNVFMDFAARKDARPFGPNGI